MTDGSRTPAGWYPAPHAGGEQRYWDGNQWLEGTPAPTAAQPAAFASPTASEAAYAAPPTLTAPAPGNPMPAAKKPLNIIGLIALIVAGLGFIFACIPGALIVGWILLPIGFVLAIVSFFMKDRGKGLGIAGLIVSVVGTIVGVIVFFTVVAVAFDDAFSSGDTQVTAPSAEAEDDAADTEDEPAAAAEGTRENPYPIGSVIENDEWRVVVNSVTLAATDAVIAANTFNEPPVTGNEYIIVNYSATYLGADAEGAMPAFVAVEYVTADGTTVNTFDNFVVPPDPSFDGTSALYTDGTATGNIVFDVPSASAGQGVLAVQPGLFSDKVFVAVQ